MRELSTFDHFQAELRAKEDEIARMLPPSITREMFFTCALAAIKGNPSLLQCDRRSLHIAITRAAQDGLPPDSRLAVIVPVKDHENGVLRAAYIPMYQGIIQRAYELGDIAIRAKIVCEADVFEYDEGDNERLMHRRAFLKPRGNMIASYAIFTRGDRITHREVMSIPDIEKVRSVSKAKNGPWLTWYEEMAKKTVIRKGAKQVAFACNDLRRIVERDDDLADLDQAPLVAEALTMPVSGPAPVIGASEVANAVARTTVAARPDRRQTTRNVLDEGFGPLPGPAQQGAGDLIGRRIT